MGLVAACGSSGDNEGDVRPLVPLTNDPPANSSAPTGDPQRPPCNPDLPPVNSAQPEPNPQQPTAPVPVARDSCAADISTACSTLCGSIDQRCYGSCNTTCSGLSSVTVSCLREAAAFVNCLVGKDLLTCRDNGDIRLRLGDCGGTISDACRNAVLGDN
jgi:hypothetical protein